MSARRAVLFSLLGVSLSAVPTLAGTCDFEDGQMRGTPTQMQVPPKLLTESGNTFMRITGSTGDCQSIPDHLCPRKNRSSVRFTQNYTQMPVITRANQRQAYSARLRFHDNTGTDGTNLTLYQDGEQTGGYGTDDGQGPVVIFLRKDGRVRGHLYYRNGTVFDPFDLGVVPSGTWHTYGVVAVWSHQASEGQIEIYLDGHLKKRIRGRESTLGPSSNRLPQLKLGLYGDAATGILDVDDVSVDYSPCGGASRPTPGSGPPPTPDPPLPSWPPSSPPNPLGPEPPTPEIPQPTPPPVVVYQPPSLPPIRPRVSVPTPPVLRGPTVPTVGGS